MILPIVFYPDPLLRKKGAEIGQVTEEHRSLAGDMFETMYEYNGLGLAAQQVGKVLQLAVIDVRGSDRPSQLFVGVREMPVESMMPLVLINPLISKPKREEKGGEGCLSFPGLFGDVVRAGEIAVEATDLEGKRNRFTCTGLLARAIQHEVDHLNGVLFIDRMKEEDLALAKSQLREMEQQFKQRS